LGEPRMSAFWRATTILVGLLSAAAGRPAHAEDLDAGKSGPALFASNCSACHHTPRGLAKHANSWALRNFLDVHYTTSRSQATDLAAYLLAVAVERDRKVQTTTRGHLGPAGHTSPSNVRHNPASTDAGPPRPPAAIPLR
jgi:mono/diheme cytochrome c family protein